MGAEAAALTRTWKVGTRYSVTLTVPKPKPGQQVAAVMEWQPDTPDRLSQAEITEYLDGRNAAIAELSSDLGLRTLVIDL